MTTWTPATQQAETWTASRDSVPRTFSPLSFSLHPTFDTGPAGGYWPKVGAPSQTWTNEAAP